MTEHLVSAIDVASYQIDNIDQLLTDLQPEHVVVRFYLGAGLEQPPQDITRELVRVSRDHGCTVGGYFWGYIGYNPVDCYNRVMDLATELNVSFDTAPLWVDVETYTDGSIPGESWLRKLESINANVGVYSGRDYWKRIGDPIFSDWQLWSANYNGIADLDVPSYGGMKLVGHQYTDTPCDRSVFVR